MIIIANVCGTNNEFCNEEILMEFLDWEGEEYYQWQSEGSEIEDWEMFVISHRDRCDTTGDEDDCDDGSALGIDLEEPLEFWSDEDPMPF